MYNMFFSLLYLMK